ncbi:hypothetical protein Hypma_000383 [Hypsizygus marmoreus]|uniref:Uncharacterized protein n=1 Tax=Hypsizygus marmoreus TaxID=39966 RepID=A0A369JAK3_HYPMA|nr:hypothetical protein Hypma_000383 [Hypsizygus marmoreus]
MPNNAEDNRGQRRDEHASRKGMEEALGMDWHTLQVGDAWVPRLTIFCQYLYPVFSYRGTACRSPTVACRTIPLVTKLG